MMIYPGFTQDEKVALAALLNRTIAPAPVAPAERPSEAAELHREQDQLSCAEASGAHKAWHFDFNFNSCKLLLIDGTILMPQGSSNATAEMTQIARAQATERMRRSRDRRRKGLRCYTLQIRDSEIEALIGRGLLSPGYQTDRGAVVNAMHKFLDHAFGWSV
jgi:hypothetical protein